MNLKVVGMRNLKIFVVGNIQQMNTVLLLKKGKVGLVIKKNIQIKDFVKLDMESMIMIVLKNMVVKQDIDLHQMCVGNLLDIDVGVLEMIDED